jgi:hypothetical protein
LVWKRRVHLVMLQRVERLEQTLAGAGGGQLVPLSDADADMWLQNIFWFNYGLDARDIVQQAAGANGTSLPHRLVNSLFNQGKGFHGFMQNTVTKELVYVNDYYGSHTHRCFHWLREHSYNDNDEDDETTVYCKFFKVSPSLSPNLPRPSRRGPDGKSCRTSRWSTSRAQTRRLGTADTCPRQRLPRF